MEEEMNQIERNETCEFVPRPKDKNVIGTKWDFVNVSSKPAQEI
jgi:hypothetical protein